MLGLTLKPNNADVIYEHHLSVVGEGLSPGREDKKRGSVRGTSKYGRIKYKVSCYWSFYQHLIVLVPKIQFEEKSGTLEVCVKGCEVCIL